MDNHADMVVPSDDSEMPMTTMPMSDHQGEDEASTPQTKQQKLFKFGLLMFLIAIIIYVVLDYTVRPCVVLLCLDESTVCASVERFKVRRFALVYDDV